MRLGTMKTQFQFKNIPHKLYMWYQKYHPLTIDDILSEHNRSYLQHMKTWSKNVEFNENISYRGRPKKNEIQQLISNKKPGVVIVGDVGTGKTCMLDVFSKIVDLDVVSFECSKMSRKNFDEFFKQTVTYKNVTNLDRGKVFRFDELESLADGDNLQLSDIIRCIKSSKIPFVGSIHTKYLSRISEYKRLVNIYVIQKPNPDEMNMFVSRICRSEGLPSLPLNVLLNYDIRSYITSIELGWNGANDIFIHDNNTAIDRLRNGQCVGYSVNNINIILHENYPYADDTCSSISYLAETDVFFHDTIDNVFFDYLEFCGNYRTIRSFTSGMHMKPASLWTKTSNLNYKKKLHKEKIKDSRLDNTYDALTTYTIERLHHNVE
jgi:hypothetical protein